MRLKSDHDSTDNDRSKSKDDINENDSKNAFFNYNYSNDFIPNWTDDAKNQQSVFDVV